MEHNLKKNMHIEFYGLPGCGKSTVSHILADILRNNGYIVCEPSYGTDHNLKPVFRKIIKLLRTVIYIIHNPVSVSKLKKLVSVNGYNGFHQSFPQIINIIQKLRIYNRNSGVQSIFIWDEGLIQAAISLSVESNMNTAENKKLLNELIPNGTVIKKIYIKESVPTVIDRMRLRGTNDSRAEKFGDDASAYRWLKAFESECNTVNIDDGILIENMTDVNEAAKMIAKSLGAIK